MVRSSVTQFIALVPTKHNNQFKSDKPLRGFRLNKGVMFLRGGRLTIDSNA